MAAPKLLPGAAQPIVWQRNYPDNGTQRLVLPIQIDGEYRGQTLEALYNVNAKSPRFSISINFTPVICRVDYYALAHHTNFRATERGDLPSKIKGPHYHSWPINRHHVKSARKLCQLHFALPLDGQLNSFDGVLKWFCADTNIQLPPNAAIPLPQRETLL